ncbi:RDD family protein [Flavobacterium sp. H122]|uniref:RDD family protein n=1 Tax=Flavobacterium sp. H122 TaxID=2529860 RepID=UPI0010AAA19F|nr:RDD family protein [Flavobacterium sp. H122]
MNKINFPKFLLASKNIRIVNFLIDLFCVKILLTIFFHLTELVSNGNRVTNWYYTLDVYELFLANSIFIFIYYSTTETILQRSISKFITKTIVVNSNGEKPAKIEILARSTLRIIPFEYLTFLRGRKLGLHDEYSSTFVVKKNKLDFYLKENKNT